MIGEMAAHKMRMASAMTKEARFGIVNCKTLKTSSRKCGEIGSASERVFRPGEIELLDLNVDLEEDDDEEMMRKDQTWEFKLTDYKQCSKILGIPQVEEPQEEVNYLSS